MGEVLDELAAERKKWDRPYVYQEYPRMLYRVRMENGKPVADDRIVVESDVERAQKERQGYVAGGPDDALKAYEAQQQAIAEAAANAQYHANRMTAPARAEFDAADEASDGHFTADAPLEKRRPGRPRKEESHG